MIFLEKEKGELNIILLVNREPTVWRVSETTGTSRKDMRAETTGHDLNLT